LNEPNGALDAELWNAMIERAVARIRETDPDRWIVVGPVDWNAIGALPSLELPDDDRLVLTVHYYDPFEFTHQGADWVDPSPPTGTTWTGEQLTPAGGWADWSWDTGREYGSDLAITYRQGWAGYYLEAGSPVTGYTELAVRTSADRDLIVVCGPFDGAPHASITTVAGVETAIPLDACGGMPVVERIVLQNGTDSAQEPFVVETLELRGPDGTLPLLVTEREAIAQAFDQVADVAERAGGIPVLVGEFGAFEAGDLDSRVRYTRAVRGAVEARGFAWTYWEFGAGFGVYDITTDTWRPGLLDALLGGLTRRGGPPWRSPAAGGVGSPTSWAG
ncbi:MAG: cellulase family glycosylhydrolase, partial [Chloroflexi bacterium]|nr:cellulase family glycosylhydrolase [Chloroflexota bacterium]